MERFENDDVIVEGDLQGRDRCLITFTPWTSSPPAQAFASGYHSKLGADGVFFRAKHNAWWEGRGTGAAIEYVRRVLPEHRRRIAYGSSMGAFGALVFASPLGCSAALALSPQVSIDRAIAPWEARWAAEAAAIDHRLGAAGSHLTAQTHAFVAYDPRVDTDRRHANAIAVAASHRGASVTCLPLSFSGHPTAATLQDCRLLDPLVRAVIEGTLDTASFTRNYRQTRKRSPNCLFSVLTNRDVTRRHPRLTLRAARTMRAGMERPPKKFHFLCARLLGEANATEEALRELELATHDPGLPASEIELLRERLQKKASRRA
jgi:hypothetical protein